MPIIARAAFGEVKTPFTLPSFSTSSVASRILAIPAPWLLAGFFLCLSLYLKLVPPVTNRRSFSSLSYDSDSKRNLALLPSHSYSSYNPFSSSHSSPPSSPTVLRAHPAPLSSAQSAVAQPKRKPYGATHGRKWSTGKDLVREMEELLEEQEEEEARGLVVPGGRWTGVDKVDWGAKGQGCVGRESGTISPRRASQMDPRAR